MESSGVPTEVIVCGGGLTRVDEGLVRALMKDDAFRSISMLNSRL